MLVVVPFVPGRLHPVTAAVLRSYTDVNVMWVNVGDDDDAYRRLLKRIWGERQTVVIVEQDVVPWPGAIDELHHCMGEWCSCAYRIHGGYGVYHHLGCTKLSAALMQKLPDIWDQPRHWASCDVHLRWQADQIAVLPHPHRPPVIHLSPQEIGETT